MTLNTSVLVELKKTKTQQTKPHLCFVHRFLQKGEDGFTQLQLRSCILQGDVAAVYLATNWDVLECFL